MSDGNERIIVERCRGNFSVVHNDAFLNRSLSLKATGLHYLMLSLPPTWDFTIKGLATLKKDGIDSIRAGLQELEQFGYLVRRQEKSTHGAFGKNIYILYECPSEQNPAHYAKCFKRAYSPSLDFPTTGNPATEKPVTENPTQLSIKG